MVPPLQLLDEQPQVPSEPQRVAQPPQLFGSLAVAASQAFVPSLSQSLWPPAHVEHEPPLQYCDAVQVLPQPPQLFPSLAMSVSQPLAELPSQSAVPRAQAEMQLPFEQLGVEPEHVLVQVPQWFGSMAVWISQPLVRASLSQSA